MTDLGNIELAEDCIAFAFDDKVTLDGMFENKLSDTIIALSRTHKDSANMPRWGTVIKVSDTVKDKAIVPGSKILIKELRWSFAIPIPNSTDTFHVTKECEVLAIEE